MKIYELIPQLDSRHSFYGKAQVMQEKGEIILLSYCTKVCTIKGQDFKLNHTIRNDLLFSMTTLRHIKEFLFQELGAQNLKKSDLVKTLGKWATVDNGAIKTKGENQQ